MVRDFSTSGPNLFDEIVASNTLSLNQSRSIAGTQVSDRKKFELREGLHVAGQALRYPRESLAVMSGFGNDMTTRHLVTISRSNAIKCVVGRMSESTVCLDDLSTVLKREQSVAHMDPDTETLGSYDYAKRPTRMYEYNGYTHAAADNLLKSAGFMLQTVMR